MTETNTATLEQPIDDLFAGCEVEQDAVNTSPPTENTPEVNQTAENEHPEVSDAEIREILPDFDTLAVGEKIAENTVVLEMHIGRAGIRRKIDPKKMMKEAKPLPCDACYELLEPGDPNITDNGKALVNRDECDKCLGTGIVKNQVNPEYFHATKDIIDANELKPITRRIGQLQKFRNARCVKASMLADGFYVLSKQFINEMDVEIESAIQDIEKILDDMEPRWETICEASKANLGEHWSRNDYPPFHVWRKQWEINSRLRGLNVPALLNEYNEKIAKREYEKLRMDWANTAQEVRDATRAGFTHLVTDFASKLGRDEKGEFKTFTKNLVEKLSTFCTTFEARDLTGDTQLAALAAQVKQLVEGVDPKALRKDEALRGALENGFKQIAEEASKLVVVRERTVSFDDEDL